VSFPNIYLLAGGLQFSLLRINLIRELGYVLGQFGVQLGELIFGHLRRIQLLLRLPILLLKRSARLIQSACLFR